MTDLQAFSIEQLRERRGLKWNEHPTEIIPAWVAEMDFPVADPIRRALQLLVDSDEFGYPPRGAEGPATRLQHAFAARMASRYGWEAEPRNVRLVADLEQAMIACILAFSGPGDAVVLQSPVYPPFRQCIVNAGRQPLDNPLVERAGCHEIDFAHLAACMHRSKVLLLCNPQNPTGRVFRREELAQVAALAEEHCVTIVSDEIHSDLVFEGHAHIPIASLPGAAAHTVTITSATKAFNIPGLRCGVMHFANDALHERFRKAIPDQMIGHPNIAGLRATLAAWEQGGPWLAQALDVLAANRARLQAAFASALRPLSGTVPEGTFMSWIDARALPLGERSASNWLLERARVAMNDGATFGPGGAGCVRLNFATSPAIFAEILERLAAAVRDC